MHNFLNIIVVHFCEMLLALQIILNVCDSLLSSCAKSAWSVRRPTDFHMLLYVLNLLKLYRLLAL